MRRSRDDACQGAPAWTAELHEADLQRALRAFGFRGELRDAGVLTEELEAKIGAEVKAEVEDATTYAEEAPEPDPETAMKWVFAEDWPGETPPPWGFTLRGTGGH